MTKKGNALKWYLDRNVWHRMDKETAQKQRTTHTWQKWMSTSQRRAHSSTVTWATWEEEKEVKEREYWISSLIRENSMSFVINQAETFNYKTNYGVANASHLTRACTPRAEQDIFMRWNGGVKKREEGRMSRAENECMTDMIAQTRLC